MKSPQLPVNSKNLLNQIVTHLRFFKCTSHNTQKLSVCFLNVAVTVFPRLDKDPHLLVCIGVYVCVCALFVFFLQRDPLRSMTINHLWKKPSLVSIGPHCGSSPMSIKCSADMKVTPV